MIDRPADEVWAIVGDFSNVDWIPGVDGSLELEEHEATITVNPHGSASQVTWDVITDDDRVDDLKGGYQHVLDALKATLEDRSGSVAETSGGSERSPTPVTTGATDTST